MPLLLPRQLPPLPQLPDLPVLLSLRLPMLLSQLPLLMPLQLLAVQLPLLHQLLLLLAHPFFDGGQWFIP